MRDTPSLHQLARQELLKIGPTVDEAILIIRDSANQLRYLKGKPSTDELSLSISTIEDLQLSAWTQLKKIDPTQDILEQVVCAIPTLSEEAKAMIEPNTREIMQEFQLQVGQV